MKTAGLYQNQNEVEVKTVEGYALSKGKEVQFCLCLVSAYLRPSNYQYRIKCYWNEIFVSEIFFFFNKVWTLFTNAVYIVWANAESIFLTVRSWPAEIKIDGHLGAAKAALWEGLNGVKRVAWNVQKINRVSWKRKKINHVTWFIFVQITVLFVAIPKLWTFIWCIWSIWYV